jgi:HlyD family secretion protein
MNRKKMLVIVVIIALLAAIGYGWRDYRQQHTASLTLFGNVDIRTVNLGFRVGGRLASLDVDEGSKVHSGQLLGKLDDGPYLNALKQAQANAQNAQAQLSLLRAGYRDEEIAQVRSEVSQREAAFRYADSFLKRQQGLWASKATSADELDNARTARNQAQANLQASKDKLTQYLSGNRPQEIAQAEANLAQREAELAQALLNLQDTTLLSPSAGTVLTRAVWVRAYVSEPHLNQVIPGTQVDVFTDGRPDKPYRGKIGFVSPTAEFTPKTVETPDLRTDLVYRLRIIITDADESLRQGMPVTIRFAHP